MKRYVLGFLFGQDGKYVALLHKTHPQWQAGKVNGIGGKIEDGELPLDAMRREFLEEAGFDAEWHGADSHKWDQYCHISSNGNGGGEEAHEMYVFRLMTPYILHSLPFVGTSGEIPHVYPVDELPDNCIPNLKWLIPMALSMDADAATNFLIAERYD